MNVTGHTSGTRPERPERPVSIRDVAAAASVSYQTVSRVINNHPRVKDSTRAAVLATISELGFRPNRAARSLAGGPVHAVTVLTSDTTRFGYAATLQGIEEAARASGFAVGIRVLESASASQITDTVQRAVEPGTALIVVAYDRAGTRALAAIPPDVPFAAAVETPSRPRAAGKPWVWLDDGEAAREATRFLLDLGHRTVHYVPIPSSTSTSRRLAGWRGGLRDAGAPVPDPPPGGWTAEAGYRAGRRLAADPAVTAVLCGNDDLAVGVMRAMAEAGRDIPGQVSVVGFDDTPNSAYLTPALTSVRLDFVGLGRAAFALLHTLVDPLATARASTPARASTLTRPAGATGAIAPAWATTPAEPELVLRESAGPPPGAAAPGRR
jgi:DNA-binding LacI/PurR family transcriptional regulator